jgi:hypothetical protein
MINVHELEQARKDFAYIAAQKDIEYWQQWEEWQRTQKEAKIILLNELPKHNTTETRRTLQEGV